MEGYRVFQAVLSTYFLTLIYAQVSFDASPPVPALPKPVIKYLHIHTVIKYTYAKTFVNSRILNPADKAQEVNFRVTLPEEAFITRLVMIVKGVPYEAYVKGKEEAKKEYDAAVSAGIDAAHVYQESRNSKDFTVAVNVEPQEKISFNLTYEEALTRRNKRYTNEISVNPNQIVDDLKITVDIEDVLPIINVEVPQFKMSNEVDLNEKENEQAKKTEISPNKTNVVWSPSVQEQRELNENGLNGKMIVKYDVDTTNSSQQILVDSDGYFVHIIRNDNLPSLNKHVVFVLDVSGSMHGTKMEQLKDAMKKILSDLSESDYFSIVLFSVKVIAWVPGSKVDFETLNGYNDIEPANVIVNQEHVIPANKTNIEEAMTFIKSLDVYGGTNIMGGLRNGLKISKLGQKLHSNQPNPPESMIIFLTDGQPNAEEANTDKIVENIKSDNTDNDVAIFSLGFGTDVDLNFLKKLSLSSGSFARRIYADADASVQLINFFKEVATPILSDVKFEYLPDQVENTTKNNFKNFFLGSDMVVLGKVKPEGNISATLVANSVNGTQKFVIPPGNIISLPPIIQNNKTFGYLEKMWAYKTIKTLLDQNIVSKNETIENKAKELALKYSFVTPLTSLVVVKPNDSSLVEDKNTKEFGRGGGIYPMASGFGGGYGPRTSQISHSVVYSKMSIRGGMPLLLSSPMMPQPMRPMGQPGPPSSNFQMASGGLYTSGMQVAPVNYAAAGIPLMAPEKAEESPEQEIDSVGTAKIPPSTTVAPSDLLVLPLARVTWLNMTAVDDKNNVELPAPLKAQLQTNDVIAMNMTDLEPQLCPNNNPCRHFANCILKEFVEDPAKFIPFKCHIDPIYLGTCCPS